MPLSVGRILRGFKPILLPIGQIGVWAGLLFSSVSLGAVTTRTLNFQGFLTDPGGGVINTTVDMTFRLYDAATGGALLWTESHNQPANGIQVVNGVFNVDLGNITALPTSFGTDLYVEIQINVDPPMTPRFAYTGAPFALQAGDVYNRDIHPNTVSIPGYTGYTGGLVIDQFGN
jgi:hypothetical protein